MHSNNVTMVDYRPDIDGLRAIAVSAVIIFHYFPKLAPGGFVGVDIFFVISGFLIANIILKAIERKSFQFAIFFANRIKRIFPSLLLVITITLIFTNVYFLPDQRSVFNWQGVSSLLFVFNLVAAQSIDYFNQDMAWSPFTHLWSLGVELQFYFSAPFILFLCLKKSYGKSAIISILLISFFLNVILTQLNSTQTYFLIFTRYWQFLCGSVLAIQCDSIRKQTCFLNQKKLSCNFFSLLGFLSILLSIIIYSKNTKYPGLAATLPTIGACLIIFSGPSALFNSIFLRNRLIIFIGKISYPLYLWHYFLLYLSKLFQDTFDWTFISLFLQQVLGEDTRIQNRCILEMLERGPRLFALLISILASILTYRYVEKSIWNIKKSAKRLSISLLILSSLLVIGIISLNEIFVMGIINNSDIKRFISSYDITSKGSSYREQTLASYHSQCLSGNIRDTTIPQECYTSAHSHTIMIWGDSHAMQLRPGLDSFINQHLSRSFDVGIVQITSASCPASNEPNRKNYNGTQECESSNKLALDTILRLKPDLVIIAQAVNHLQTDWTELSRAITSMGAKHIIILGPVPRWSENLPRLVAFNDQHLVPRKLGSYLMSAPFIVDQLLAGQFEYIENNVTYVSAISAFCFPDRTCRVTVPSGDLVTHDSGHITPAASVWLIQNFLSRPILKIFFPNHHREGRESESPRVSWTPIGLS